MKLNLGVVPAQCELLAYDIVQDVNSQLCSYTTVSVERAILRLFGLNTGTIDGVPHVNRIAERIDLSKGALHSVACYLTQHNVPLADALSAIANGDEIPNIKPDELAVLYLRCIAENTLASQLKAKELKQQPKVKPLTYLIVATGNVYEDAKQAYAAAVSGADIIAVIRSTAQSLLDYIPIGLTTEGFGGTFATYENFMHVRKALDKAELETGKRKYLTNYASGLCMPEIAVCGAMAGLDMLLNDSMYGILFRDINPKRTLIDQLFSRKICAKSGIIINTGEDNYLTTSDAVEKAYTVTASQFINRAFAHLAEMPDSLIGLGHAHEIDPTIENSMVMEIAHALLTRDLFPNCPIKYMPPTKHMCGDIFFSHAYDTMYNLVSVLTEQDIHLVGMLKSF
jgi:beta-lysine 5,6-aminomutase alpha subunit